MGKDQQVSPAARCLWWAADTHLCYLGSQERGPLPTCEPHVAVSLP